VAPKFLVELAAVTPLLPLDTTWLILASSA
jgi:hypothetical protein